MGTLQAPKYPPFLTNNVCQIFQLEPPPSHASIKRGDANYYARDKATGAPLCQFCPREIKIRLT